MDVHNVLTGAVREGRAERAREEMDSFAQSCSEAWSEGCDIPCDAMQNNHAERAKLLSTIGAKVICKSGRSRSDGPLYLAVANGDVAIVEMILRHFTDIDAETENGETALHIATRNRRKTVVKLLLRRGCGVDIQDEDAKTTLRHAVEAGYSMGVKDVLKYFPNVNNHSNTSSLKTAIICWGKECTEIVEVLLDDGYHLCPEYANDPELLHDAVANGYSKIVEHLLKYGADVNMILNAPYDEDSSPLHCAVRHSQDEIVKLLISCGADINALNKTGKSPIFYAVMNANLNITEFLLNNRANVEDYPEVLVNAVKMESIEIINALLQHEADINAIDQYGRTVLHYCGKRKGGDYYGYVNDKNADDKNKEIAKLLLHKGANVDAQTEDGETTLHAAVEICYKEVVKVLLECGANVDSKMNSGTTSLHLCAVNGNQEILEFLLKFGAVVNSTDENGETPLHISTACRRVQVVESLLDWGSDINISCEANYTPFEWAMYSIRHFRSNYSFAKIAYFLKRHIVQMKTANLYVSEKNLMLLRRCDVKVFQNECEKEIGSMKCEKISNSNISFYDILTKGTSSLAIYLRNENVVQVLESDDYKTKFPVYTGIINCNFRKGMVRKGILEQGNEFFHLLCNTIWKIPYECAENIFGYLSDKDLRMLIDACK